MNIIEITSATVEGDPDEVKLNGQLMPSTVSVKINPDGSIFLDRALVSDCQVFKNGQMIAYSPPIGNRR